MVTSNRLLVTFATGLFVLCQAVPLKRWSGARTITNSPSGTFVGAKPFHLTESEHVELAMLQLQDGLANDVDSSTTVNDLFVHVVPVIGFCGVSVAVEGMLPDTALDVEVVASYENPWQIIMTHTLMSTSNTYFFGPLAKGKYFVKLRGTGYYLPGAVAVEIDSRDQTRDVSLKVEPMQGDGSKWDFSWRHSKFEEFGIEYVKVMAPIRIPLDDRPDEQPTPSTTAIVRLGRFFCVEVAGKWTNEMASRVLHVLDLLPFLRTDCSEKKVLWKLVSTSLVNDFMIVDDPTKKYLKVVEISIDVFTIALNVVPQSRAQTRRLDKLILRIFLDNWKLVETAFEELFNVKLLAPNRDDDLIETLTGYNSTSYQSWSLKPQEAINLAATWLDLPLGFRKIKGMNYLLRRKDGMIHPDYPGAAALAFPSRTNKSYVEFLESGAVYGSWFSRLVIHELSHMIQGGVLSPELFKDFINVGEWRNIGTVKSPQWVTPQQTEHASSYGHKKGPVEDFAETMALYVINSVYIGTHAPAKYEFLKTRVFGGTRYVQKYDHTVEVKGAGLGSPELEYPGRLISIDITVEGKAEDEKTANFRFEFFKANQCVRDAEFVLWSPSNTFKKVVLKPSSKAEESCNVLVGVQTFPKTLKGGVWTTRSIQVYNTQNFVRHVGVTDFSMSVWINNSNEDFSKPIYLPGTLKMSVFKSPKVTVSGYFNLPITQYIRITALAVDDKDIPLTHFYIATNSTAYSDYCGVNEKCKKPFGDGWDEQISRDSCYYPDVPIDRCRVHGTSPSMKCFAFTCYYPVTEYHPTAVYQVNNVQFLDTGENYEQYNLVSHVPYVFVSTLHPDLTRPELMDLKIAFTKSADCTTLIKVSIKTMDSQTPICYIRIILVDPVGSAHSFYKYYENYNSYKVGQWNDEEIDACLKDPIPGKWAIKEAMARDLLGNKAIMIPVENVMVSERPGATHRSMAA